MAFVLDASIAGCWALSDEDHPIATIALNRLRKEPCTVPALWWFEIRNILIMGERRKRITAGNSTLFLRDLLNLPIHQDNGPDESETLRLARQHELTVYDAAYLELAQRKELLLATLDSALLKAARAEGVPVLR